MASISTKIKVSLSEYFKNNMLNIDTLNFFQYWGNWVVKSNKSRVVDHQTLFLLDYKGPPEPKSVTLDYVMFTCKYRTKVNFYNLGFPTWLADPEF